MPKGWNDGLWRYVGSDFEGRKVVVTVAYDPATLAIINPGLVGNREPGCLFDTLVLGRTGEPDVKTFAIPEGDFGVSRVQLRNQGFETIQQVADANVTLSTG